MLDRWFWLRKHVTCEDFPLGKSLFPVFQWAFMSNLPVENRFAIQRELVRARRCSWREAVGVSGPEAGR